MKFSPEPAGDEPLPPAHALALITDALAWPLLLMRGDGSLLHANQAAREMLARQRPLMLGPKGIVQPSDNARRAEFAAAGAQALQGRGAVPPQVLQWMLRGGRTTVSVAGLPGPGGATLLLVGLSPAPGHTSDLRAYAALHGLSEAETRVLLHLARGDSSAKAAAALGVSAATVRSQTVSLRRKTGHRSVAALMRSLAALPPVAPEDDVGEK